MFSKFRFKKGEYDKIKPGKYNTKLARYYALKLALEAKYLSENDLLKIFNNQTLGKL